MESFSRSDSFTSSWNAWGNHHAPQFLLPTYRYNGDLPLHSFLHSFTQILTSALLTLPSNKQLSPIDTTQRSPSIRRFLIFRLQNSKHFCPSRPSDFDHEVISPVFFLFGINRLLSPSSLHFHSHLDNLSPNLPSISSLTQARAAFLSRTARSFPPSSIRSYPFQP